MERKKAGVYTAEKKDGTIYYRSSITYKNKHISLGSFDSEDDANLCYLEASNLLGNIELGIDSYSKQLHISFEKWVVLCNYRDNGIYIANPIYVRPKLFYYYFAPGIFFIFSKEDLFYYSAHKIQKRGGHYFISDYGSQINLLSRYGIQSYAVEGRDYVFLNGNSQDMQYGNIQILNPYHGVILQEYSKIANDTIGNTVNEAINSVVTDAISNAVTEGPKYIARIHINGYIKLGVYPTAIEAAIAYNKAIDIIRNAGIDKQYPTNYIDGLSAKSYADIYSSIEISSNLLSSFK